MMTRIAVVLAVAGLGVVCRAQAQKPAYKEIYNFHNPTDGFDITSTLVHDSAGNFYGTAFSGGTSYGKACSVWSGCGTVFKITAAGKKSTLHNFGLNAKDGQNAESGVILSNGSLYGTTVYGGRAAYGTVFAVLPNGQEKILHTFTGKADGGYPIGGLVADRAGTLYGVAEFGGDMSQCSGQGCGTIFKITPGGKFSVLYSFTGGSDGASPAASMIIDANGNLYGTAGSGGSGCISCGVVFELTSTGKLEILHTFVGGASDGESPSAPVTRDHAGNLYGTTVYGGAHGIGTVYKIDSHGKEFLLHSFGGSQSGDGQYPRGGLILGTDGALYGTASIGGKFSPAPGVIYKLTSSGKETILHNFRAAPTDGQEPDAALTPDGKGNLFGTTAVGGDGSCTIGCGIIFRLTP